MKEKQTYDLLQQCAKIHVVSEKYTPGVFMRRNRYMVERSSQVIAVYDGREKGGTAATVQMAIAKGKALREIPLTPPG